MKKYLIILIIITIILSLISCETETPNSTQQNIKNFAEEIKIIVPTVSFNTNGGSYIEPIKTNVINYEPTTTRQDHVFDGWYLDSSFITPASFPLEIKYDTMLYAKWIKTHGYSTCENPSWIKGDIIREKGYSYTITPRGYELERLAQLGYSINVTVSYDVYYKKDYDVLFDIGYLGAPEYETYIVVDDTYVKTDTKIKASTNSKSKTLSYTTTVSRILNSDIKFNYSTDNIQNKIYFENMIVEYNFYK